MDPGHLDELVEAFNEFESTPPGTGRVAALMYQRDRTHVLISGDGPIKRLTPEAFERLVLDL